MSRSPRISTADEIGAALLKAGREHVPPVESRRRALAGLGLSTSGVAATLTHATNAGAAPVKGTLILGGAKWVGLAALALSSVATTAFFVVRVASVAPPVLQGPRRMRQAEPAESVTARQELQDLAVESMPMPHLAEEATTRPVPGVQASKRSDGSSEPAQHDALGEELELLQRARSAVRDGDAAAADSALRAYARSFPRGRLKPEAMVLRVDLLMQQGEPEKARALAHRFVEAYPDSPHAVRLRTM